MKTALLAVFLLPCAANAETVDFVMTGTGRNCSTCYNWSNDTYTLTVVTDNAVSSLANQSWTAADVSEITLSVMNSSNALVYSATYYDPNPTFTAATNALGTLSVHWTGTNFGEDLQDFDTQGKNKFPGNLQLSGDYTPGNFIEGETSKGNSFDLNYGTFDIAVTPLPDALSLVASGAGFIGLLGWGRKRKTLIAAA